MIADRIFTNAAVFDAAGADTVTVHGNSIVGVGRGVDRDMIGKHTEITDLGGASLLPGFVDAHAHPVAAGMSALRCDLSGLAHDRQSYLAAIAEYAAANPDEAVIAGRAGTATRSRAAFRPARTSTPSPPTGP